MDSKQADMLSKFNVAPLRFYDQRREQEMAYIYPDTKSEWAGWLLYKHPDGQWVSLRKATDDDIMRLSSAVSEAHHG